MKNKIKKLFNCAFHFDAHNRNRLLCESRKKMETIDELPIDELPNKIQDM